MDCNIYRLVLAARSGDILNQVASACRAKSNEEVYSVTADVGLDADCQNIVTVAKEKLGGVDILLLNAAYSPKPNWFENVSNHVSYNVKKY